MFRVGILTVLYSSVYDSKLLYDILVHSIGYTQCMINIVQGMHRVEYPQCREYINSVKFMQCRVCRAQGMKTLWIYAVYGIYSVHTVQGLDVESLVLFHFHCQHSLCRVYWSFHCIYIPRIFSVAYTSYALAGSVFAIRLVPSASQKAAKLLGYSPSKGKRDAEQEREREMKCERERERERESGQRSTRDYFA